MSANNNRPTRTQLDEFDARLTRLESGQRDLGRRQPFIALHDFDAQGTPMPSDGQLAIDYNGNPPNLLAGRHKPKYGLGGEWHGFGAVEVCISFWSGTLQTTTTFDGFGHLNPVEPNFSLISYEASSGDFSGTPGGSELSLTPGTYAASVEYEFDTISVPITAPLGMLIGINSGFNADCRHFLSAAEIAAYGAASALVPTTVSTTGFSYSVEGVLVAYPRMTVTYNLGNGLTPIGVNLSLAKLSDWFPA